MTRGYLDAAVAVGAALLIWIAVMRWRDAVPERALPAVVVGPAPDGGSERRPPSPEDVRVTIERNPFRLSRLAADVRFGRPGAPAVEPAAAPMARPTLVLRGIVGGPPWTAIIDGLPGQAAGTLAREGSIFDKLLVRTVTAAGVVVQAPDTTWQLTLIGARRQ